MISMEQCELCNKKDEIWEYAERKQFIRDNLIVRDKTTVWHILYECARCGTYWEKVYVGGGGFDDGDPVLRKLSKENLEKDWPEIGEGPLWYRSRKKLI